MQPVLFFTLPDKISHLLRFGRGRRFSAVFQIFKHPRHIPLQCTHRLFSFCILRSLPRAGKPHHLGSRLIGQYPAAGVKYPVRYGA